MSESANELLVRVRDDGQWFEDGVRVEYVRIGACGGACAVELAALGAYEVRACTRLEVDGERWLDLRLRRLLRVRDG